MPKSDSQNSTPRLVVWAAICVVVAALYFAWELLIPVTLAVLLSFLLAPLLTRLERTGLPRPAAVAILGTVVFSLLGLLMWAVILQIESLAGELPSYQENMVAKVQTLRGHDGGTLK